MAAAAVVARRRKERIDFMVLVRDIPLEVDKTIAYFFYFVNS
jgi:hypothetical protein